MILYKDNATARLKSAVLAAATTIPLGTGQGSLFPAITASDSNQFFVTIINSVDNKYEIVLVNSRNGDNLIVTRGQQGTIGLDFPINSLVELRWTAAQAEAVVNYVPPKATTSAFGTVRLATSSEVSSGTGDGVPSMAQLGSGLNNKDIVGTIIMYPSTRVPAGYLASNGASVSRSTYADLFAVIGTTFGGSGSNFNLPDLRGKFIRGTGSGAAALGVVQTDTVRSTDMSFKIDIYGHVNAYGSGAYYRENTSLSAGGRAQNDMTGYGNRVSFGPPDSIAGSETRPINTSMNFCIKY